MGYITEVEVYSYTRPATIRAPAQGPVLRRPSVHRRRGGLHVHTPAQHNAEGGYTQEPLESVAALRRAGQPHLLRRAAVERCQVPLGGRVARCLARPVQRGVQRLAGQQLGVHHVPHDRVR